jgi:hypothetical protein
MTSLKTSMLGSKKILSFFLIYEGDGELEELIFSFLKQ